MLFPPAIGFTLAKLSKGLAIGGYAGLGAVEKFDDEAPLCEDDPGFCMGSSIANGSLMLVRWGKVC